MSTLAASNLKNASSGSNNIVLNTDGTTTIAAPSNIIKSGTAVASTSGVAIDFTGLPSWVKRITIALSQVSVSGTSQLLLQFGSGTFKTSGYTSVSSRLLNSTALDVASVSTGFYINSSNASNLISGNFMLVNVTGNTWECSGVFASVTGQTGNYISSGADTLSGTLDRVRVTTLNGTDTFDGGTVNILYEG